MNPILKNDAFIPDVEARKFADGYLYLYGSKDTPENDIYCSRHYDVFRSKDMIHWEQFKNVFSSQCAHRNHNGLLYAPDCEYINGQYCLFYCMDDGTEGVAFSKNPYGPFRNARPIGGADGTGIDPAIFVDDDGKVYYFWGQIKAKGAELDTEKWCIKQETLNTCIINDKEHGFHEGSSLRKRNGIYYYVYADISRGRPTCLGYATSNSPLGLYTKQGIIIDNTGCDPSSWNNHGSIAEYNGQWYVFYHRATNNSFYSRRTCIEPIKFDENGKIQEVGMTTQGSEAPISSHTILSGGNACCLKGKLFIRQYSDVYRSYEYLTNLHNGDSFAYKYLHFNGKESKVRLTASVLQDPYTITLYVDRTEKQSVLACIHVTGKAGNFNFNGFSAKLENTIYGKHALTIKIDGPSGTLGNFLSLQFV